MFRAGRSSISFWFQRKATFQSCLTGVRSPWFQHSTKCMKCACGRFWTKNSDPFRISWWGLGLACSALTSSPSWWKVCGKQTSGEKSCSLSLWMWRARLTQSAPRCWENHLCGSSSERNFGASCTAVLGVHKKCSVQIGRGYETGRPKNTIRWNQVMAVLIEELSQLWAGRAPAVSWAPEWVPFEILVWADNIFQVSSSIADIVNRTQEIAYVFGKRDLRFIQSSLEILPSKTAEREATRILLNEEMELSWVRILVVLGCYLDGSGSTETS